MQWLYANAAIKNQNHDLSDYFLEDLKQVMYFIDNSTRVFNSIILFNKKRL